METLREFYKIGNGPSSSHTMGPEKAAVKFRKFVESKHGNRIRYRVELYGSLAATGKGHLTDYIVQERLQNEKKDNITRPDAKSGSELFDSFCRFACHIVYLSIICPKLKDKAQ